MTKKKKHYIKSGFKLASCVSKIDVLKTSRASLGVFSYLIQKVKTVRECDK